MKKEKKEIIEKEDIMEQEEFKYRLPVLAFNFYSHLNPKRYSRLSSVEITFGPIDEAVKVFVRSDTQNEEVKRILKSLISIIDIALDEEILQEAIAEFSDENGLNFIGEAFTRWDHEPVIPLNIVFDDETNNPPYYIGREGGPIVTKKNFPKHYKDIPNQYCSSCIIRNCRFKDSLDQYELNCPADPDMHVYDGEPEIRGEADTNRTTINLEDELT